MVDDPTSGNQVAIERPIARLSLGDRRKAALRLEIACHAVELFTSQGVAATTVEQIAQAVGVSTRTLWRHFPTKESCVRPLLAAGMDAAIEQLRHWPPHQGLVEFFIETCRLGNVPEADLRVFDLIRMTYTEPALRAVWLQAHDDALPVLAELLAARSGRRPDDLRVKVHAATINGALRAGAEEFAQLYAGNDSAGLEEITSCLHAALKAASEGLPY